MPSPFPGMDPYLEAADLWEDVHANLATELRAQLQPQLIPRYVAVLTPYVTYEDIAIGEVGMVKPDIAVLGPPTEPNTIGAPEPIEALLSGVTTIAEPEVPAKAQRIEVRTVGSETLVTVIEILSPANKRPGAESFEAYQRKRRDMLRSPVHLLEIDLLRRGVRWPIDTELPPAPYFVFLSRAARRPTVAIWPITFEAPLPRIPVPLRSPDPDAAIDLGAALARVYELGAYHLRVNYRRPPPAPALSADDAAWLDGRLRSAGLR
jgi:Protein of unknown function (DUF4058)